MFTSGRVGVAVQVPARDLGTAIGQGAYLREQAGRLFLAPELSIARDEDKGAVRVRLDAAGCRSGVDRLGVALQMIERPRFVPEPCGRPRVTGAQAQSALQCFECLLVTAVEAQHDSEIKVAESEVPVQLD